MREEPAALLPCFFFLLASTVGGARWVESVGHLELLGRDGCLIATVTVQPPGLGRDLLGAFRAWLWRPDCDFDFAARIAALTKGPTDAC